MTAVQQGPVVASPSPVVAGPSSAVGGPSSRESAEGAGWTCTQPGSYRALLPTKVTRLSWFNPKMLWRSRNDVLARLSDPVPQERARWVGEVGPDDLTVDLTSRLGAFTFLLMGDTGEGDDSQYAVVPPLLAHAPGTAFLLICSDVLYPIGDVNDYAGKFYRPYAGYPGPVYALPGNHDWYDDLYAFMYHFCGRRTRPGPRPDSGQDAGVSVAGVRRAAARAAVRQRLWRRPAQPDEAALALMSGQRGEPGQSQPVPQPGPYFVIDTEHVRLVCIDTGILGNVDEEQGRWLLHVSADERPKILLTGKPLLVDGESHPCAVTGSPGGFDSVLDIVHHDAFRYAAVIGGDIHNYQRYPVRRGTRTVQHVVSGGGGAFMHATHLIPRIDPAAVCGVTEEEFRCYPLRRDSLAAYSRVLQGLLRKLHVELDVTMTPDEAASFLAGRLGLVPLASRPVHASGSDGPEVRRLTARTRTIAQGLLLFGGKSFHKWFSPFYDWDTPPFFKQFLRLAVDSTGVDVTCYGVTGCADAELTPPVEDSFRITW